MLEVFYHTLVLVLLMVGPGFWFWRLTRMNALLRGYWWLWCLFAGFATQLLLMEQVYRLGFDLPMPTWIVAGVSLAGIIGWGRALALVPASIRSRLARQIAVIASVAMIVGLIQGASLLGRGPMHYFGRARIDQENYVAMSQLMVEGPHGVPPQLLGLRPWLARATEIIETRIAECVPLTELTVITRHDAQRTYGAVSVFYVVLLAVAIVGLLGAWGVEWRLAALAGIAAGCLPAITETHLESYLSQSATLWVLPAIAGVLTRNRADWAKGTSAGIFAGFSLGAYIEFSALAFVSGLAGILLFAHGRRAWRLFSIFSISAGLLNIAGLPTLGAHFVIQTLRSKEANFLAHLAQESGTWAGWGRNFVGAMSPARNLEGGVVAILAVGAFLCARSSIRRRIIVLAVGPLLFGTALWLKPHLPVYPFAKLLRTAAPLVVVLLAAWVTGRDRNWRYWTAAIALVSLIAAGSNDVILAQREILAGTDAIAKADVSFVRTEALFDPKSIQEPQSVLVDSSDELEAAWLSFHTRRHRVHLLYRSIADIALPAEWSECRQWPGGLHDVYVVSRRGVEHREFVPSLPQIESLDGTAIRLGPGRAWRATGTINFLLQSSQGVKLPNFAWVCFVLRSTNEDPNEFSARIAQQPGEAKIPANQPSAFFIPITKRDMTFSIQGPTSNTEFVVLSLGAEPVDVDDPNRGMLGLTLLLSR